MIEKTHKSSSLTSVQRSHLDYWRAFNNLAAARGTVIKPHKPYPQAHMRFALGRSGFHLTASASTRDSSIKVRFIADGPHAKRHFDLLYQSRQEIENELGEKLDWRKMPHNRSSRVYLTSYDANPMNRDDWPRQHAWLLEKLEAFHRAFAARIIELDVLDPV